MKRNLNTKIATGILAFVMVFSVSCKKSFLDLHSEVSIDAGTAIVDVKTMKYALSGIYNLVQNANYYNVTMVYIPDLLSDNVYMSRSNTNRYRDIERMAAVSTDSYAGNTWTQIYKVITNCNLLIQAGTTIEVPAANETEKKAILGQGYAIRALAHFDLVRLYAQPYNFTADASHLGVPLILQSSIEVDQITNPARNTVKEVYEAVVNDLKTAISLLPADNSLPGSAATYKGKISFYAAKALLSKVYLYMEDWDNCEKMASDVITGNKYSLLSTNDFVAQYPQLNSSESIFEIDNLLYDNNSDKSAGYLYSQVGYGEALPTLDIYNSYEATDVRRGFMTIGNRAGNGGEQNVPLLTKKFIKGPGPYQDLNVIRLAEVYLNRAEARAHLSLNNASKISEAISDLSVIAGRADPNFVAPADLSAGGQALIDRILLERRKELAFEGNRLFDITRNKKTFWKFYSITDSVLVSYPNEKTILPIPRKELDIPGNQLVQNPGYGN